MWFTVVYISLKINVSEDERFICEETPSQGCLRGWVDIFNFSKQKYKNLKTSQFAFAGESQKNF
jgi:hypothetical protein